MLTNLARQLDPSDLKSEFLQICLEKAQSALLTVRLQYQSAKEGAAMARV